MVNDDAPDITAAQVRAARGWLCWTQDELARRSGLSQRSVARFELEISAPYASTVAALRKAFEDQGISFDFEGTEGKGVRVR
jgi:predicted transcriptional regulator